MLDKILKYFLCSVAFWAILLSTGGLSIKYLDFLIGYFQSDWQKVWITFIVSSMLLWSFINACIEYKRHE